jgi:hypothetical protein
MTTKQMIDLNNAARVDASQNARPVEPVPARKRKSRSPAASQTQAGTEPARAAGSARDVENTTARPADARRTIETASGADAASAADVGSERQAKVAGAAIEAAARKKTASAGTKAHPAIKVSKSNAAGKVSKTDHATRHTRMGGGAPRDGSKTELVLKKLHLAKGASIEQLVEATGWQPHSVRGFLSAVVRKKMSLNLTSETSKDGVRRYRIADGAVS